MSPDDGQIEHLKEMRRVAQRRQCPEEGQKHAVLAQAPKAFPHAVPGTELGRQRPSRDVMNREIMHAFEKLAVVAPLVAAARAAGGEDVQHYSPIFFGHPRQDGRPSKSRPHSLANT